MKKITRIFFSMLISFAIIHFGCKKDNEDNVVPTIFDQACPGIPTITYGGQVYNTVLIGNQCWLKENLNIGTMISGNDSMQDDSTIEKYCYDNDPGNCETYGGLYQWGELMQYTTIQGVQGICPDGWHIPGDAEWKILEGTVDSQYNVGDPEWNGLDHYRGLDAGKNLKFISGWYNGGNGIDKFGFCALPGGYLTPSVGFEFIFKNAFFWTSTESLNTFARQRGLLCSSSGVRSEIISKVTGLSVRCIKD